MEASLFNRDDERLVDEVIRQAEARISAQLQLAIAADQRAMSLAASSSAVAAASFGVAVSQFGAEEGLFVALTVVGVGFGITTGLAAWSARPSDFAPPGFDPRSFLPDMDPGKTHIQIKREILARIQERIDRNRRGMAMNGLFLSLALWIASLTPFAAGLTALLS
jgi:hypothetical protein